VPIPGPDQPDPGGTRAPNGERLTLPPPEWSGPRIKAERRVSAAPAPLARCDDAPPAAEGVMRARLEAARAGGDRATERDAAARLARWLASRDRGLDEATALARRVIEIDGGLAGAGVEGAERVRYTGDDAEIRLELASWLECLGEAAPAADVLRPLAFAADTDTADAARVLVRVGVLHARAGDAAGANDAFVRAANLYPSDPLPTELRGTIAAWAPQVVLSSEAAEAYVAAANQRLAAGALDAQMEDLLRAFDADPASSVAVAALASALIDRGRGLAADEAWRAHATALQAREPKRANTVHARRRLQARAAGDVARALGAALDEGLDGQFEGEGADVLDDLLLRVGLLEPLAARLELRAEAAKGAQRARTLEELARLYAGPLASPGRAAAARVLAVEADPTREDSFVALRAHANVTRDATELVEALIRAVGIGGEAAAKDREVTRAARVAAARALAALAEDHLRDSALARWAWEALLRFEPSDTFALAGLARSLDRAEALRQQVEGLQRRLDTERDDNRVELLRALAALLRSRPDEGYHHASVLAELTTRAPDERPWCKEAIRLAWRRADYAEAARLVREQIVRAERDDDRVEGRVSLAAAARAMGDFAAANQATRPLLTDTPGHRGAAGAAWVNAALAGDGETRAAALEQLAAACGASVRGIMLAVASDAFAAVGDKDRARRLGELACQTDPSSARCVASLADAVAGARDRLAASALERGVNVVFARGGWCAELGSALEALAELSHAVGWTQRCVALRPGDRGSIDTLLKRIARARDGARLADGLSWVLSQPQPTGPLAEVVARSLRDLALLDTDRAAVLARRALDAFGARYSPLRDAMLEVAEAARDDAFAAVVLERALAVDFSADRADLVRALAMRRATMGDPDGEARALARAMREQVRSPELEARVVALKDMRLTGDGELARLEAMAEMLDAGGDRATAAAAWREYGGALWDLAGDRVRAVRAWLRAAKLAVTRGFVTLGMDLARFAGSRYALDCLASLVENETDRAQAGALASEAARAALALGEPARALDLASLAIERNPSLADALEIAEKGATACAREPEMSRLYDGLAARALGRFARRAAHYRGARFFEQRGDRGLALKHAAQAFFAVPSEGATFAVLKRTAERADDRAQAVRTIVQVADATASPAQRAAWLLRAATLASGDEEGCRLRVDVLLRSVLLSPDLGTLAMLFDAARDLLRVAPEERDSLEMRLGRASRTVTAKVDGPDGARMALRFARLGEQLFDDEDWALRALERALQADADLEEYGELVPEVAGLARAKDAKGAVERVLAMVRKPYANVGLGALKLMAALAAALGDAVAQATFVVTALEKEPESDALVLEADRAVLATQDESLLARLRKVASDTKRSAAIRAFGRDRMMDAAYDDAIRAFERAADLVDDKHRGEVELEIRAAYDASGRAEEVEERALRDANNPAGSPAVRAGRWSEVAQRREARADLVGAVDALLAAASLDSGPIERWSALERVAQLAVLDEVRVHAIREIAARVDADARPAVLKRLARAYESRLDANAAEATWLTILETEPNDEEADYALEALITARGDYSDLANHLGRRAERLLQSSGTREALRAVRLRRAAILEQRLSRTQDACDELAQVLRETPDNASAMSYLADLQERMGEFARAAPLWKRVAALSRDARSQGELEMRAARASYAAKDPASALEAAKAVLAREPDRRDALELRVEAARALRDDRELGDALEDIVQVSTDDTVARSEALLEAARTAERIGEFQVALGRAQRAAKLAPDRSATQLLARSFEYRARGAGTPEDARRTVEELGKVRGSMARDDAAVHAYLIAEALDTYQGGGAGMRALTEKEQEIGAHPLLALGMAERLVAKFDFEGAVDQFQEALFGDFGDLRDRGRVALAGADAAARAGLPEIAVRLLEEAAIEPGTRSAAMMRAAQLALARGDPTKARNILRELGDSSDGDDRARALAQLGRIQLAASDPDVRAEADATFRSAIDAAPSESALAAQLLAERATRDPAVARSPEGEARLGASEPHAVVFPPAPPMPIIEGPFEPSGPAAPASLGEPSTSSEGVPADARIASPVPASPSIEAPDAGAVEEARSAPPLAPPEPPPTAPRVFPGPPANLGELERAMNVAKTPQERSHARFLLATAHLESGAFGAAELCLREGLREGAIGEGDLLASLLERSPGRAGELVKVRQRLVELASGDLARLEQLRAAAIADNNPIHARAIEHVARAFDLGAGPLPPPPLSAQTEQPGMLALLMSAPGDRVAQALTLLWESAHTVLAREPSSYAITGTERVVPGSSSTLARAYELAIRLLDMPRVPLYLHRAIGALTPTVALLWPAAAVLTGHGADDVPEAVFAMGEALASALPAGALCCGLSPGELGTVWNAMVGAFGPPESSRSLGQSSGRLAESFWQTIPARAQRQLQSLLAVVPADGMDAAREQARQSARRVGLFLTGDFGVAVRRVLSEKSAERATASGIELRRACAENAAVADLLTLAVSPEYADARFRPGPPSSSHRGLSSGKFSVV
jgi:tetratricopeptide (TPR) repeat protein